MSDDSHQWPMTHAERRALIQDGDDTDVSSVVVPRVWQLPPQPARGISVRDRHGTVWQRPGADPDFVGLWHASGMTPQRWSGLLERGPLTEVM